MAMMGLCLAGLGLWLTGESQSLKVQKSKSPKVGASLDSWTHFRDGRCPFAGVLRAFSAGRSGSGSETTLGLLDSWTFWTFGVLDSWTLGL